MANAVAGLAAAQACAGATVTIAALAVAPRIAVPPGVELIAWKPSRRLLALALAKPLPLIDRTGRMALAGFAPEVVHAHGELNPVHLQLPRLFTCPLVLSPHGGFAPPVIARGNWLAKAFYIRCARQGLYRRSLFHAASRRELADIAALLGDHGAYCAPHGPGWTPPRRCRPAAGPIRLLYVGRLSVEEKGLDLLVDAFARARGPRPDLELTLAGADFQGGLARLRARCLDLRIAEHVHFLGACTSARIAELHSACHLYVQLSRNDAFGLSAAEALIAGMPAILSDAIGLASFAEIAGAPQVRVIATKVDAAAAAIVDCARREDELSRAASADSERLRGFLSWEHSARLHLAAYAGLLGGQHQNTRVAALAR